MKLQVGVESAAPRDCVDIHLIVDMRQVSIAELRQNPTPAFDAVARGETVEVTRYRQVIGRIVPAVTPRPAGPTGSEVMAAFAAIHDEILDGMLEVVER